MIRLPREFAVACLLAVVYCSGMSLPPARAQSPDATPAAAAAAPSTTAATNAAPPAETTPAAEKKDQPADSSAPAAATAPATSASASAAAAEFQTVLKEWRDVVAQAAKIHADYRAADGAKKADLRKQWDQLLSQAEGVQKRLIAAAKTAYAAEPKEQTEARDLLLTVAYRALTRDDYTQAYELSHLLAANGEKGDMLFGVLGTAAYCTNHFDEAEKYLGEANQKGVLSDIGKQYLGSVGEYKELWQRESQLREAEAKADDLPRVLLKTNKGDVVIELFENEAPNTVANFISLVDKGFYNGLTFHRVIGGFMAQGGDPTGTGGGGPGYAIACECYKPDARMHFLGSLSMAHAGRDTGGSQFFLTFLPTPHLNGKHTVFGRVIEGFDVLPLLERRDPNDQQAPQPDKIIEAKVLRKRSHPYEPEKLPGR